MSDPKPCPFCGSTDVGGAGGAVSCYRCNAKIEVQNTNTGYAVELWNRRANESELTAARDEAESLWETFVKVADYLGIDPEQARKIPGKPSQVFRAAVLRKQAEAVEAAHQHIMTTTYVKDNASALDEVRRVLDKFEDYAQRLRQQADEVEQ